MLIINRSFHFGVVLFFVCTFSAVIGFFRCWDGVILFHCGIFLRVLFGFFLCCALFGWLAVDNRFCFSLHRVEFDVALLKGLIHVLEERLGAQLLLDIVVVSLGKLKLVKDCLALVYSQVSYLSSLCQNLDFELLELLVDLGDHFKEDSSLFDGFNKVLELAKLLVVLKKWCGLAFFVKPVHTLVYFIK